MTIVTKSIARTANNIGRALSHADSAEALTMQERSTSLAGEFKALGITARKGPDFAALLAAMHTGWNDAKGEKGLPTSDAVPQPINRAIRNALRINGDAEGWDSKKYPDAHYESLGGRGLGKDWQPVAPAATQARGSQSTNPSQASGGADSKFDTLPENDNTDSAGNTSSGKIEANELIVGAAADITALLEVVGAEDTPLGNRIAALASSAIRKLEIATGSQLA